MATTLVIANKLYSSWSLRPWLLLKEFDVPFEEVMIPLRQPDTAARVRAFSPAGKVPVLVEDGLAVWDSLAIVEYLAERWPDRAIWPRDREARAQARSVSAEMHSGFSALRRACPMNLGKRFGHRDRGEAVSADVARIEEIWRAARTAFGRGGDFLFGAFTAADAMYAPVVTRLDTYGFAVSPGSRRYMNAVLALPAFRAWRDAALHEPWVVDVDEVDEPALEDFRALSGARS